MKSRTSQILYSYWNEVRGTRIAPRRFDIEPARMSSILSETFILERALDDGYPFRLAGTRICDSFGFELRGRDFLDLAGSDDRQAILHVIEEITDRGAVGVIEIEARTADGRKAEFETLLLPLVHSRQEISRYLGSISAIDPPPWLGAERLTPLGMPRSRVLWPEGRPHVVIERAHHQAPFLPALAGARIVRSERRQFRVLDGGRKKL